MDEKNKTPWGAIIGVGIGAVLGLLSGGIGSFLMLLLGGLAMGGLFEYGREKTDNGKNLGALFGGNTQAPETPPAPDQQQNAGQSHGLNGMQIAGATTVGITGLGAIGWGIKKVVYNPLKSIISGTTSFFQNGADVNTVRGLFKNHLETHELPTLTEKEYSALNRVRRNPALLKALKVTRDQQASFEAFAKHHEETLQKTIEARAAEATANKAATQTSTPAVEAAPAKRTWIEWIKEKVSRKAKESPVVAIPQEELAHAFTERGVLEGDAKVLAEKTKAIMEALPEAARTAENQKLVIEQVTKAYQPKNGPGPVDMKAVEALDPKIVAEKIAPGSKVAAPAAPAATVPAPKAPTLQQTAAAHVDSMLKEVAAATPEDLTPAQKRYATEVLKNLNTKNHETARVVTKIDIEDIIDLASRYDEHTPDAVAKIEKQLIDRGQKNLAKGAPDKIAPTVEAVSKTTTSAPAAAPEQTPTAKTPETTANTADKIAGGKPNQVPTKLAGTNINAALDFNAPGGIKGDTHALHHNATVAPITETPVRPVTLTPKVAPKGAAASATGNALFNAFAAVMGSKATWDALKKPTDGWQMAQIGTGGATAITGTVGLASDALQLRSAMKGLPVSAKAAVFSKVLFRSNIALTVATSGIEAAREFSAGNKELGEYRVASGVANLGAIATLSAFGGPVGWVGGAALVGGNIALEHFVTGPYRQIEEDMQRLQGAGATTQNLSILQGVSNASKLPASVFESKQLRYLRVELEDHIKRMNPSDSKAEIDRKMHDPKVLERSIMERKALLQVENEELARQGKKVDRKLEETLRFRYDEALTELNKGIEIGGLKIPSMKERAEGAKAAAAQDTMRSKWLHSEVENLHRMLNSDRLGCEEGREHLTKADIEHMQEQHATVMVEQLDALRSKTPAEQRQFILDTEKYLFENGINPHASGPLQGALLTRQGISALASKPEFAEYLQGIDVNTITQKSTYASTNFDVLPTRNDFDLGGHNAPVITTDPAHPDHKKVTLSIERTDTKKREHVELLIKSTPDGWIVDKAKISDALEMSTGGAKWDQKSIGFGGFSNGALYDNLGLRIPMKNSAEPNHFEIYQAVHEVLNMDNHVHKPKTDRTYMDVNNADSGTMSSQNHLPPKPQEKKNTWVK